MKPIKIFGLAVLAALMAMAFAGAGSAAAESTELCTLDPGTGLTAPCPNDAAAVSYIHEESIGKMKLLTDLGTIECNVLFASTKVGAAGAPQVVEGHFTYTNCGCTVKEKAGTTASTSVLRTGHEIAKMTTKLKIDVKCIPIAEDCTFTLTVFSTFEGPLLSTEANGKVNVTGQEASSSGFFCPKVEKLDLEMIPLAAIYIGKGGALHYCVKYTTNAVGLYTNSTCTTLTDAKTPTHTGEYELAISQAGLAVDAEVCVHLILKVGLYKNTACSEDLAASLYEKALVKTVQ